MRVGKNQRVLQNGARRAPNPPSCGQNVYYKNKHIKLSWIWMNVFFFVFFFCETTEEKFLRNLEKFLPKICFPWIKDINNLDQTFKINHKILFSHLPFSFSIFPGKFVLSHVWLSSIGLFLVSISGFQLWYKQQSSSKENIALPFFYIKECWVLWQIKEFIQSYLFKQCAANEKHLTFLNVHQVFWDYFHHRQWISVTFVTKKQNRGLVDYLFWSVILQTIRVYSHDTSSLRLERYGWDCEAGPQKLAPNWYAQCDWFYMFSGTEWSVMLTYLRIYLGKAIGLLILITCIQW